MFRWFALPVSLLVAACGSSGAGSSTPTGSALLSSLSASELGPLCDSEVAKAGGYNNGTTLQCPGGTEDISASFTSQAECITETQGFSACTATVDDLNGCLATGWPLLCGEGTPAACAVVTSQACMPESSTTGG